MKTYCPECHVHESGVHNEAVYCSCCGAVLVDPPPKKECPDCNELNAARSNYCTRCRHYFGEKIKEKVGA